MTGLRFPIARGLTLATLVMGLACALAPRAAAAYAVPKANTVYHFVPSDYPVFGNFEDSPLIQASDGNLYGVSTYGGVNSSGYVYRVSRSSGQLTHLHDFAFDDGVNPRGRLFQASDGYLYGTTESGGANQSDYCYAGKFYNGSHCGTAFRISLAGQFQKLHDFYSEADGYQTSPNTGLVQAGDGNFYGMAMRAFPSTQTSLFRMTPTGAVSVLHLFNADQSEGYLAYAGLTVGADGQLYGTTSSAGGTGGKGCGTLFRAGLDGSLANLHVFTGSTGSAGDGCVPWSTLTQGSDGTLYGVTLYGGYQVNNCRAGGCGIVYKLTTSGVQTVLHRFTGTASDGEYPQANGVALLPDGSLWGATGGNPYGDGFGYVPLCTVGAGSATAFSCGTLYQIDAAGQFTQQFVFGDSNGAYGLFPHASLLLASDGNLYGTTIGGGAWGVGTVYRLLLNAATPIVAIDSFSPPGGAPGASVVLSGTGFIGTTQVTIGNGSGALPISFSVQNDSTLTALIPASAQSSAFGVSTPRGITYSPASFYLAPTISSITPSSGRVGSGVTLLGAHFDALQSITFGGGAKATKYSYVTNEDTAINVTIPRGAKTGPIVVTNAGGSATSAVFTVKRGGRLDVGEGVQNATPIVCSALPGAGQSACAAAVGARAAPR